MEDLFIRVDFTDSFHVDDKGNTMKMFTIVTTIIMMVFLVLIEIIVIILMVFWF